MTKTSKKTMTTVAAIALMIATIGIASIAVNFVGFNSDKAEARTISDNAAQTSDGAIDDGLRKAIDRFAEASDEKGDEILDAQADQISQNLKAISDAADSARNLEAVAEPAPATSQASPAPSVPQATAPAAPSPCTINVDGDAMGYIDYYRASSAPASGAGLWLGSDSTTDGSWGYFIGHNPGDFHHVMDLSGGEAVTVTDRNGATRTYHVIDVFTVTNTTYWEDIESRVTGHGESIVLQTCVGDGAHYRIAVAA